MVAITGCTIKCKTFGIEFFENIGRSFYNEWNLLAYRKVVSSRLFQLVAHPSILRLFIKGRFDAYVL